MNRYDIRILTTILSLCFVSAGNAEAQERKVAFDLKTSFVEKLDLLPAQTGAFLILTESEWGSVREFGEDYSIWLRNAVRREHDDSVLLEFDLELRHPSFLEEGELIRARRITVTYSMSDDWRTRGVESVVKVIQTTETCVEIATSVAGIFYPAATLVALRVADELEKLMPGTLPQMKLEAMVAGGRIVEEIRTILEETEREGAVSPSAAGNREQE